MIIKMSAAAVVLIPTAAARASGGTEGGRWRGGGRGRRCVLPSSRIAGRFAASLSNGVCRNGFLCGAIWR